MTFLDITIAAPEPLLVGAARRLIRREFEDGQLLFDLDSGETQLLSHLAYFLWQRVCDGAANSFLELCALVQSEEPEVAADQCAIEVGQALEMLVAAGLLLKAGRVS